MVARAWPVSVEGIQDWLLAAPSQTSPPSCFYTEKNNKYNLLNFCFASFCTNIFQVNFTQMEIK